MWSEPAGETGLVPETEDGLDFAHCPAYRPVRLLHLLLLTGPAHHYQALATHVPPQVYTNGQCVERIPVDTEVGSLVGKTT